MPDLFLPGSDSSGSYVPKLRRERAATMTIEIHRPELEALIMDRMKAGAFQTVEEVIMQALKTAPPAPPSVGQPRGDRTGADLITALQSSPYREIEIEPARCRLPVRDATF
jgi:hypothetical protein